MKRNILFAISALLVGFVSCYQESYNAKEPLQFKNYHDVKIDSFNYTELLYQFLADSTELILNEETVLKVLEDSIDTYLDEGEFKFKQFPDSIQDNYDFSFSPHDYEINCFLGPSRQIFHKTEKHILYEGDLIDSIINVSDSLIKLFADTPKINSYYYVDYRTIRVKRFEEELAPKFFFSVSCDVVLSQRDKLLYFKKCFREFYSIYKKLQSLKAEEKFQKSLEDLSEHQLYFIEQFYPVYIEFGYFLRAPPPYNNY